jgi:soluble lytic murein transglycosylase
VALLEARALKAEGRPAEAQALLTPLASISVFMASSLPRSSAAAARRRRHLQAGKEEVQAIGALPGLQRALAFYRLNLRFEGNREWNWTVRPLDDKELLAAAGVCAP